jgi:hypothetical protein
MILNKQLKCITAAATTVAIGVSVSIGVGVGVGVGTGTNIHHTGRSVCCGIDVCLFQWSHQHGIVIQ